MFVVKRAKKEVSNLPAVWSIVEKSSRSKVTKKDEVAEEVIEVLLEETSLDHQLQLPAKVLVHGVGR